MSAPSGDSGAGLAFALYAPTPLAEAWAQVRSPQGTAAAQLARRFAFVEQALQLLVGILDAERSSLGLPVPPKRAALVERIDKPTLGLRAEAARDLARQVGAAPATVLKELASMICAPSAPGPYEQGLSKLIDTRNEVAHRWNGQPPEAVARELLEETAAPLRAIMLGLDVLKRTPLIVVEEVSGRHDGQQQARVIVFQGHTHTVLSVTDPPRLAPKMPALLTSEGVALWLAPWVMFSDFGDSNLPHLRTISGWDDEGPTYGRPGFTSQLRYPELPSTPRGKAGELLNGPPPYPRNRQTGLEVLWLRIARRDDSAPPPEVPGYRIDHLLGRGASGTVWQARSEATNQRVALKVLHPALAESPLQRARLEREHQALQRVSHPGVARVYELLPSSPVGPVLVMEAVEGRPLNELAAARPMDPTTAARLCGKVLAALGAIHALGLVHRDVKPANILMDVHGEPRLVDFGVARAGDLSNLTGAVDVVGTVAFAAPEQLTGGSIDGRADLFAVGRLLPTLCSAEGDWAVRLGRLPGALQHIVRRATQEDPAQRYPNAVAMQRALEEREIDGWDGPPVGVGDLLPGGLRLVQQLEPLVDHVWLFLAQPGAGVGAVGVLVAGAGPRGRDALEQRLRNAKPEVLHQARCGGLRIAEDGLIYAELRGDEVTFWARRLLGVVAPEGRSDWTDLAKVGAVLGGVAALAVGALGAMGLGVKLHDEVKRSKPSLSPHPTRDALIWQAQAAGLLLHALAHANREVHLERSVWETLCASPLKAPLRVLGEEGDGWCGPVGQVLTGMEGRKLLLAAIAGLSVPSPLPDSLKKASVAVGGLQQAVAAALAVFDGPNAPPYARRVDGGWEVLLAQGGEWTWARVR